MEIWDNMQIIDLYSGIGGFSIAGDWIGWRTIYFCEIDKFCQKILNKHWPNIPIHDDINTLTIEQIKNSKLYNDKENTIITAGVPCQPASVAGRQMGSSDNRWLWPQTIKFIGKFKSTYVLLENVAGLVSMENGKTLDKILSDLENEGYTVESFIIPACAVGAWHRRDRIWIIAYRQTTKCKFSGNTRTGRNGFANLYQDVPDTINQGLQRRDGRELSECTNKQFIRQGNTQNNGKYGQSESRICRMVDGFSYWSHEPQGIPRVATGIKDRVNRLKGLGNAIVPQVAYELFKVIEQWG